eukprot:CAMPEP_0172408378 /NCGR_PEP_ID=MMETSP1061-20121228/75820_1 /TAXON_ID=37318 /ORGANISM="Pseudo-nitzschia pungens, Strain cf. pungens" /LENGTH=55 /DNA_ID=CAMNT_0013144503 /DNA_START=71 /DNA_END=238 /DNA_ORIENTATION=-
MTLEVPSTIVVSHDEHDDDYRGRSVRNAAVEIGSMDVRRRWSTVRTNERTNDVEG